LGASVLVLTALALIQVSFSYDAWIIGPAGRLRLLALGLFLLAAGFVYVTVHRRVWFARWAGGPRPANLRSLRELYWQAWLPLVLVAAFGFGLMILFAYRAVRVAPYLGSTTVALLAVTGLIPVGSFLVYLGNRASLPVVTLVLIWAAISTYAADNHYVRLYADMHSYRLPDPPPALTESLPEMKDYFADWTAGLAPNSRGDVPILIVTAEGGGIRAAYWTALVLGELEDQASAAGLDFGRRSPSAASRAARSGRRSSRPSSRTSASVPGPDRPIAARRTRASTSPRRAGAPSACCTTISSRPPSRSCCSSICSSSSCRTASSTIARSRWSARSRPPGTSARKAPGSVIRSDLSGPTRRPMRCRCCSSTARSSRPASA
jgi:hypothetical protein